MEKELVSMRGPNALRYFRLTFASLTVVVSLTLTSTERGYCKHMPEVCWSPDGKRIAVAGLGAWRVQQDYVIPLDGGDSVPPTEEDRKWVRFPNLGWGLQGKRWPSPDGKYVGYVGQDFNLWLATRGEGEVIQITFDEHGGSYLSSRGLAWSPNSKQVAFFAGTSNEDLRWALYVAEAETGRVRLVKDLIYIPHDLAAMDRGEAVRRLTERLADLDWRERNTAAIRLGELKDKEAVESLANAIERETHPVAAHHMAKALGEIGDSRAVPSLIDALHRLLREDVRARAAQSLGIIGDRKATKALIDVLGDSEWRVRREAVIALGKLRDESAITPLGEALRREQDIHVCLGLIDALSRSQERKVLPALTAAMREKCQTVANRANIALEDLTGLTFGFAWHQPENERRESVQRWESWWEANKHQIRWNSEQKRFQAIWS